MTTYLLHGLRVRSGVPLPARTSTDASSVDVEVVEGAELNSEGSPSGRVLAESEIGYVVTETDAGYTIRFHSVADFEVDRRLSLIRVRRASEGDNGLVPILLGGNVLAMVLALAGACVLHASAVEIGGRGLGIVGASGMGKSTLAAVFCAAGAALISDDLLRVSTEGEQAFCFTGTGQIRLRPSVAAMAERFESAVREQTCDGRLGVYAGNSERAKLPLDAVVIPQPVRDGRELHVERLTPRDGLIALVRYPPQVLHWRQPEPVRRQFALLTGLVRRVPVYRAEIPWGPPFDNYLPSRLSNAIGFDRSRSGSEAALSA